MAEFENVCEAREINLYVLPIRSPKLNGGVERANGTRRREFRECENLPDDLSGIDCFADLYNYRRRHVALKGRTPRSIRRPSPNQGWSQSLN